MHAWRHLHRNELPRSPASVQAGNIGLGCNATTPAAVPHSELVSSVDLAHLRTGDLCTAQTVAVQQAH